MSAPPVHKLLELAKTVATAAGTKLLASADSNLKDYVHSAANSKEIKARADAVMDEEILSALKETGLPILSEESGLVAGHAESPLRFIVDPLDGTFNFVKGLGPSAVSIALWKDQQPLFGVVYRLDRRELSWGGRDLGAQTAGHPIAVSRTASRSAASLCTGFPARHDLVRPGAMEEFWSTVAGYAKVRMLGSAAASLLHVANGSSDAYCERDIMLWDIAAGAALVEGAGGVVKSSRGTAEYSLNLFASNPLLAAAAALG